MASAWRARCVEDEDRAAPTKNLRRRAMDYNQLAEQFVSQYYNVFDNNRGQLLNFYVRLVLAGSLIFFFFLFCICVGGTHHSSLSSL